MTRLQDSVRGGLLRPFRKAGLAVAQKWPWPVRAALPDGGELYVDLRSAIGRGIFATGEFDPRIFDAISASLHRGDVFLDVGANIGYYSVRALRCVGETGAVHAFEIDPRPLACLTKTQRQMRLQNLYVHRVAVGAHSASARLIKAPDDSGQSRVGMGDEGIEVPMIALDEWWQNHGAFRIAAIKIDIEGGELDALRGAPRLLCEQRPAVICEDVLIGADGRTPATDFLTHLNYEIAPIAGACTPAFVATAK